MKTYLPGEIATIVGVSSSSVRNWTEQLEIQEFLSDMAVRRHHFEHAKQREYTLEDLYVMNTITKVKTRHNSWEDVATLLRSGELHKDLRPSAALVMQETAAEGFADKIMLHQRIEFLESTIREQESEIDQLRDRVDQVRIEERNLSKAERTEFQSKIEELNRFIGKLEAKLEFIQEQDKDNKSPT